MEAQRYPADYDGILAGAPANNWTALLSTAAWDTQALTLDPGELYSSGENSHDRRCRDSPPVTNSTACAMEF